MRKPTQVAIYIYRTREGVREYLLLQRVQSAGGFWQGVSGGVEDDETVLETARRELQEETGFTDTDIKQIDFMRTFPVPESMKHHFESDVHVLTEYSFHTQVAENIEPVLDPIEHVARKWVAFEDAIGLLHFQANIDALKLVEQELCG